MKRTAQMRRGNVTGSGHSQRWPGPVPVADIPRHSPLPRQVRRAVKAFKRQPPQVWPKWAIMSPLLDYMFRKAGLMVAPE